MKAWRGQILVVEDSELNAILIRLLAEQLGWKCDCSESVERLQKRMQEQGANCVTIDGVRVTTADGWWLVRASNTQNILVARCEGRDNDALQRLKTTLSNELASCGLQVGAF